MFEPWSAGAVGRSAASRFSSASRAALPMSGARRGRRPGRPAVLLRRLGGLAGKIEGAWANGSMRFTSSKNSFRPSKPSRGACCLVGDQPLRVRDVVGVEREAERQDLRDRQRVEHRPRLDVGLGQLERGVLGRERVRREPGVHAVRVRLERRAALRRDRRLRAQRCAAKAERPQLGVARECARAEQLGERAARLAAARIHLEQPVLRVQVADHEVRVVVALGEDVRHAERVAQHLSLPLEARDVHGLALGTVRQRCARQGEQCGECEERSPRLGHGDPPSVQRPL